MSASSSLTRHYHPYIALFLSWSNLNVALPIAHYRNLQEKINQATTRYLPLDDFDLPHSCDITGIISKFQSWEHSKSDEVAGKLTSLAQDMIEYSKFHHDVMSSWRGDSPVRILRTQLKQLDFLFGDSRK